MSDTENRKIEIEINQLDNVTHASYDLSKFKLVSILNNNSNRKLICILGYFLDLSETDKAIILFEKKAFTDAQLKNENEGLFSATTLLTQEFVNDIYGNFECFPPVNVNAIKTTIIYPATEKHIQKYSCQDIYIIQETPKFYNNVTLPHLQEGQFTLDWVYNILNHKQEVERIVFEDPDKEIGFVLLPDLKWDGKTKETLYLLAITHKANIKSLRDLNSSHLPLLRNIQKQGVTTIVNKYGVQRSQLRIYLHYQPSFYHLHIHFTYLKHDAPGIFCEKSHLLDTVINNIELMPDYYQKATLSFTLRQSDPLLRKYQKAGNIFLNEQSEGDLNEDLPRSHESKKAQIDSNLIQPDVIEKLN